MGNSFLSLVGATAVATLSAIVCTAPAQAQNLPDRFFAPYVDATLYPTFDISGTAQTQGIKFYTLAFVVASGDTVGVDPLTLDASTLPAWGAFSDYRVNNDFLKSAIVALRAQGGDVMVSFGGAANTELAGLYSNPFDPDTETAQYQQRETDNVAHLKEAYQFVIDTYELTHIDYDVEGGWVAEPYSIQLRSKAIKGLQDDALVAGKTLKVWFTLPVLPTGLDNNGRNVMNAALDAGVLIDGINVMAMDYGDVSAPIVDPATGGTVSTPNIPTKENDDSGIGSDSDSKGMMGDYGIQAAQGLFTQMKTAFTAHGISHTDAEIWRKVGLTPMLGVNDVETEVVDLSEAAEIYHWALSKDIGMLSFWSITRDRPASAAQIGQVSPSHHGLSDPAFAFSQLYLPYSGNGGEAVYVSDATVEEDDTGTQTVSLRVLRLPATNDTRVIDWSTADDSATAGNDYQAATGSITFGPGETEKFVTLTILNETDIEENERFTVNFTTTSGVPIPDPESVVTITDDDTPPTASINDVIVAETESAATFTVTLNRPVKPGLTASIDYTTAAATATSPNDFTAASGTLTFTGTEVSKTITVPVIDDTVQETDEVFVVTLSNPTNTTLTDLQGLGAIQDNDTPATGGFSFDVTQDWGTGWNATLTFTNPGPGAWTTWQLSLDSTWNADFWDAVTNPGLSTDDGNGNYHHVLDPPTWWAGPLAAGASYTVGMTGQGADSSPPTNVQVNGVTLSALVPALSINDLSVSEDDTGSKQANLTVTLAAAHDTAIHLSYAIVGDTATDGADFTSATGTLVFAPGDLTKSIPVTVLGDLIDEDHETVTVHLAGVDGQTPPRFTDAQGTLTITDDDEIPQLIAIGSSVIEGDTGTKTATVRLRLSRAPKTTESISVSYQATSGTATSGTDFQTHTGTANFATGTAETTVNLTINGDTDDEALETFTLALSSPSGCILADTAADIQIIDDDTTGPLEGRRVVAYLDGTTGMLNTPPPARLTHIMYAFANLNTDGTWNVSGTAAGHLSSLADLRDDHHPHLKILLSIGGWTWSENFTAVADDPTKRAAFAQSAANIIDTHKLDGVDIDWEWPGAQGDTDTPPGANDKANYTLLMQATRDAIDALGVTKGRSYELSAFTGAGSAQIAGLDLAAIGQIFDFINVQGYDLRGAWDSVTGHHTGLHHNPADSGGSHLNTDAAISTYLDAGIPASKLLIGAAFYGHNIGGALDVNNGLFQTHNGGGYAVLYSQIAGTHLPASRRFWDDTAKVPWLYNAATGNFITYDDPQSMTEKGEYVRAHNLGGIYFWRAGGDTTDWQLLTSIHDATAAPADPDTDNDGIDDDWERTHFGNITTAGADTNHDGDPSSDLDEFHAGTDPKDPSSYLGLTAIARSGTAIDLTIQAGTIPCDVQYSTTLAPDSWATIATDQSPGPFSDTDTGRITNPRGFYRLSIP